MEIINVSFTVTTDNLNRLKLIMSKVLNLYVYEGIPEMDNIKINTNDVSFNIITDSLNKRDLTLYNVLGLLLDKENPEIDNIKISKKKIEYEKV